MCRLWVKPPLSPDLVSDFREATSVEGPWSNLHLTEQVECGGGWEGGGACPGSSGLSSEPGPSLSGTPRSLSAARVSACPGLKDTDTLLDFTEILSDCADTEKTRAPPRVP